MACPSPYLPDCDHRAPPRAMEGDRFEIASYGFDDALIGGAGGDPAGSSVAVGLRVPPLPGVWYTMLCASVVLDPGDRITGWRLLATLGAAVAAGNDTASAQLVVDEAPIVTPAWRFPDSAIVFTLTRDLAIASQNYAAMPLDGPSFVFEDSDSPAVLYESAHFPAAPALPGYLGLDSYAPPGLIGRSVVEVRDPARVPWMSADGLSLNVGCESGAPERFRLYCQALQTDPVTRPEPVLPATEFSDAIAPETRFVRYWDNVGGVYAPITRIHRVAGSLFVQRAKWRW